MELAFVGRYINLERSVARRARIEQQLAALGMTDSYSRFAAMNGSQMRTAAISASEYGCFASHARAIRDALSERRHLHILEDDTVFMPQFQAAMQMAIGAGFLDQYDLLFTDVFVPPFVSAIRAFDRTRRGNMAVDEATGADLLVNLSAFDLRNTSWACMSSYFVSQRSIDRVAKFLEAALQAGPSKPIDLTVRDLVNGGQLKAGVLVPFVTSVDLSIAADSTIRGSKADLDRLAHNVLRQTLSTNPDWGSIDAVFAQSFPPAEKDPRREAIGRVLDFVIFGESNRF